MIKFLPDAAARRNTDIDGVNVVAMPVTGVLGSPALNPSTVVALQLPPVAARMRSTTCCAVSFSAAPAGCTIDTIVAANNNPMLNFMQPNVTGRSMEQMQTYPSFDLTGQVALVTAAARGLGRDIALALAHAGAQVALGLRDINQSGGLAKEIEALGVQALPLQMNMTKLDEVRQAVKTAAAHFGRLDILVNNAGIAPDNLAENVTEEDFDRTLNINLKGTFFASQAAGRIMIEQNSGCIINMSSQAGFAARPGRAPFLACG